METRFQLERKDSNQLVLSNPYGIDVSLYANADVPIEQAAVNELSEMLEIQQTAERFANSNPHLFSSLPRIEKVALTPDFHKARGIPVGTILKTRGFVVPQAIGNDINCGMRLHTTNINADQVVDCADELETACRAIFFEAGRRIPMKRSHREAMLLGGIPALHDSVPSNFNEGLWALFHRLPRQQTVDHVESSGGLTTDNVFALDDFLGPTDRVTRGSQIGSIGGGNHFVEFQRVEKILDGQVAHAWGLVVGATTVMVHTGSVSVGQRCGTFYRDKVREMYPGELRHPANGIFVLPDGDESVAASKLFWGAMANAANFAYANRMFLALMAWSSLEKCLGDAEFELLYDAPHNMFWRDQDSDGPYIIHRKGACPAGGYEKMQGTPFEYYGEPVIVPGSMGASSFLLAGNGFDGSLSSAAHGAGRAVSRGAAMKGFDKEFEKFMNEFRVVTPIDFRSHDMKCRKDIVAKKLKELRQEAPFAYKGIGPVVQTIEDAGIARPVAELKPIMTIKG